MIARGADPQTAEDIAQEVALRAIDHNIPFHDVDDFCGWAYRVARNLYVDHTRARGRLVRLVDLPDRPDGTDLHGEVEQRLTLSTTLRALQSLDDADQAAIVAGINETAEPTRKEAVRMAVRRHRARARLLRVVEGLAAFWAMVRAGKRSMQLTPVAVAACGLLALPAVVRHFDDGGGAGSGPGTTTTAPAITVIDRLRGPESVRDRDGGDTAAGTPGTSAGGAGQPGRPRPTESTRPYRDVVMIPGPTGNVGVRERPEPERPCTFGSGDECYVPKLPNPLARLPHAVPTEELR